MKNLKLIIVDIPLIAVAIGLILVTSFPALFN